MTALTFLTYTDTPPRGSQEEHVRAMRLLALLPDRPQINLVNHDGREVLITTSVTPHGTVTSVESCTDGLIVSFSHGMDRLSTLEAVACLAVNVMSRTTDSIFSLMESR